MSNRDLRREFWFVCFNFACPISSAKLAAVFAGRNKSMVRIVRTVAFSQRQSVLETNWRLANTLLFGNAAAAACTYIVRIHASIIVQK